MKSRTLVRFRDFKPSDLEALQISKSPTEDLAAPPPSSLSPRPAAKPIEAHRRLLGFKEWLASCYSS